MNVFFSFVSPLVTYGRMNNKTAATIILTDNPLDQVALLKLFIGQHWN